MNGLLSNFIIIVSRVKIHIKVCSKLVYKVEEQSFQRIALTVIYGVPGNRCPRKFCIFLNPRTLFNLKKDCRTIFKFSSPPKIFRTLLVFSSKNYKMKKLYEKKIIRTIVFFRINFCNSSLFFHAHVTQNFHLLGLEKYLDRQ